MVLESLTNATHFRKLTVLRLTLEEMMNMHKSLQLLLSADTSCKRAFTVLKCSIGSSVLCSPLQPAAELIDSEFRPGMSNRQKNKAKRMAKLVAKHRSRDVDPNEKR